MKAWLKILFWAGMGGGIGFFAGYQVGARMNAPEKRGKAPESSRTGTDEQWHGDKSEAREEAAEANEGYLGGYHEYGGYSKIPEDGLHMVDAGDIPGRKGRALHRYQEIRNSKYERCDVKTKEPSPCLVEEDIPQAHPQNILPSAITEDEFNMNANDYDIKNLDWYEMDEVLYDPETQETIDDSEELLGIGWFCGYYGDPNNPTEVLYIQNDTMGTLYRVELVHAAHIDAVAGMAGPTDEDDGEEEFPVGYETETEWEDEW